LTAATRVIAVSEGIRNKLPRRIQTKTIVLPNGVDAAHFEHLSGRKEAISRRYGLDPDRATVIFNASRMPPWLKLSDLTEAASVLPESYQILVCGDMPYANALRDTVDGKVKFLGRVPFEDLMVLLGDIADVAVNLYDADCYKSRIPGYFENRKMKEYLAAGKPIIVADVPAKESFLNEGQNALFYRSGDPRDLADKIRRLCEDPELAKAMGRNNRTLSLEFTWEKVLERSGLLKDFVQPATGIAAAVPLGS
jgi:glycosyltransferase involved in cell wall biosynthesis